MAHGAHRHTANVHGLHVERAHEREELRRAATQ